VLAIALSLLGAGCDGDGDESGDDGADVTGVPVADAENIPGIKAKFGVTETGVLGVTAAFNALHSYIRKNSSNLSGGVINLGDWIDLEGGLEVSAYGDGGGDFNLSAADAVKQVYANEAAQGTWGRLIVAGINSFNGKNGNNTPHVVFHFQNIPVVRRMNVTDTNEGGYAAAEMRKYLVPVTGDSASGRFLAGLVSAGVPENVLWAPKRVLSAGMDDTGTVTLSDLLWLPTEREMFQDGKDDYYKQGPYSANGETADNQARLEYYTGDSTRIKAWQGWYPDTDLSGLYWLGSAVFNESISFCVVFFDGSTFTTEANDSYPTGVAPAFCVW
jgi:hypothetical protein